MRDVHVVLTGGATGIGAATCALLLARGARLTVLDRQRPAAASETGVRWAAYDQGDMASIDNAVVAFDEPVHVLLNIAGVPPRPGQAAEVLRINFLGLRR